MEDGRFTFKPPICHTDHRTLTPDVIADLQLVGSSDSVYKHMCSGDDGFSTLNFTELASCFSTDKQFLRDTQRIIKKGVPVPVPGAEICGILSEMEAEPSFREKYGYVEIELLDWLNRSTTAMMCMSMYSIVCPLLSLLLPVVFLLLPFIVLKARGRAICFSEYVPLLKVFLRRHALQGLFEMGSASWERRGVIVGSLIFYALQVYLNVTACYYFIRNMQRIHSVIEDVRTYLDSTTTCMEFAISNWRKRKSYAPFLKDLQHAQSAAIDLSRSLAAVAPYTYSLNKFTNLGVTMQRWYLLNTDLGNRSLLNYCRKFNSYMRNVSAISDLVERGQLGKAKFGTTTEFKGIVHPCIADGEAVPNDISVNRNLIITGPNAAGKTTIVKATLISIVLSQQWGYGFYGKAAVNPYSHIHSYINIPDTNARDSLFQAEARRCKDIIEAYQTSPNERHICVFDELFSGTNPYEAIGVATGFLKHLNGLPNISYLLTTHFKSLCSVGNEAQCTNVHMAAEQRGERLVYGFKIKSGVSDVRGGVQVLKSQGYPKEIVVSAENVISELAL